MYLVEDTWALETFAPLMDGVGVATLVACCPLVVRLLMRQVSEGLRVRDWAAFLLWLSLAACGMYFLPRFHEHPPDPPGITLRLDCIVCKFYALADIAAGIIAIAALAICANAIVDHLPRRRVAATSLEPRAPLLNALTPSEFSVSDRAEDVHVPKNSISEARVAYETAMRVDP